MALTMSSPSQASSSAATPPRPPLMRIQGSNALVPRPRLAVPPPSGVLEITVAASSSASSAGDNSEEKVVSPAPPRESGFGPFCQAIILTVCCIAVGLTSVILLTYSLSLLNKASAEEVDAACPGSLLHEGLGLQVGVAIGFMVVLVGRVVKEKTYSLHIGEGLLALVVLPIPLWTLVKASRACNALQITPSVSADEFKTVVITFGSLQTSMLVVMSAISFRNAKALRPSVVEPVIPDA